MKKNYFYVLNIRKCLQFCSTKTLRTVEKCRVTSRGIAKDGKRFANCVSLQSGKIFNFTGLVDPRLIINFQRNSI